MCCWNLSAAFAEKQMLPINSNMLILCMLGVTCWHATPVWCTYFLIRGGGGGSLPWCIWNAPYDQLRHQGMFWVSLCTARAWNHRPRYCTTWPFYLLCQRRMFVSWIVCCAEALKWRTKGGGGGVWRDPLVADKDENMIDYTIKLKLSLIPGSSEGAFTCCAQKELRLVRNLQNISPRPF